MYGLIKSLIKSLFSREKSRLRDRPQLRGFPNAVHKVLGFCKEVAERYVFR